MAVMVITGGTAGVGKATALHLQKRATMWALLRGRRQAFTRPGRATPFWRQFVGRAGGCGRQSGGGGCRQRIEYRLGAIDVWVNNAMGAVLAPFRTMTPDEFRRVTEVTYLGYVNGTRAALELMVPRDRGVIIQVGSALAYRSIPLQSAYCGAKAAIRALPMRCVPS